jgi:hypothetical protein
MKKMAFIKLKKIIIYQKVTSTKKFVLIFLFLLTKIISIGQIKSVPNDSIPFYFPFGYFSTNPDFDTIANRYWSSYLFASKKQKIYENECFPECYRLIHYGEHPSVIEIFKRGEKYVLIADAYSNHSQIFRTIDSLDIKDFRLKIPRLSTIDEFFWKMKNRFFYNDSIVMINDDRDNWLIELKMGEKYNVINRIEPEKEIRELITQIMKAAGLKGFVIWTSKDQNEKF